MVISIVMVLVGIIVMRGLPIAQFPEIVPPMINVTTTYVGAASIDVEQSVATPLEQQINGVENMIYMKSINGNDGTLTLQVSFDVGSNLDMSNVLTQNRVNQATAFLPGSVKNYGVTVKKSLVFPLMLITLKSPEDRYDNNFLSNYASININDLISRTKGVGDVKLFGGSDYAMRIWVKPDVLGKLNLTVPEIVKAVQDQNVISPAGQIGAPPAPQGTDFTYTVKTQGRMLNEEEFGQIIVRTNPDGSQLRLKDIARIELGTLLYNQLGRNNGKPAATIAVFQLPGSNAIEVADNLKKLMDELSVSFPPGMEHEVTLDTTLPIQEGITEIVHTLFEAVLLVILVVFIFLQNWRATLIPLLTVPVSLISTFIVFPMLGFSINTLSLLGMVLAIGIVVDDAIVVVEAVMHHIEHGMTPKDATFQAMKEVSGPVVAIALILAAVFIPVAFMGGITGRLYQQFAITIAISVLFSAFNALTLSPALAAILLKPKGGKKSPLDKFYKWFNKYFDKFTGGYLSFTGILVRKVSRSVIFVGIIVVLTLVLFKGVPGGFVPEEDNGYFLINVQLPDASSLQRTDLACKKIEEILAKEKSIDNYTTLSGFSFITGIAGSNVASFFVSLKEWSERTETEERSFEVIESLNEKLSNAVPEAFVYVFGPPAIQGLGTGAGFNFMLQDKSGNSPQELSKQVMNFIAEAKKRPEIGRIATLFRPAVPQIFAEVNRDKVLKQGVTIADVNTTLGSLLGSNYINDFNRFGRVYKVYLSAEGEYRNETWDLGQYFVRNNQGGMVPLNTLVTMNPSRGPEFTNRFNLYRSAELTGIPAPGYTSTDAINALQEVAAKVLPQGWGYEWANMSYQEVAAAGTGATVFVFALLFVFLILSAQYESWSLPLSVLLGIPFAVFGAMAGLWIGRFFSDSYVNNVFAQIGFVTLIGLAAKNAILIVEFAKMKKEEGMEVAAAAMDAAKLRLRPILMTSFAFILGVLPLVRAAGAGAESRKVMGLAVFSGLFIATFLAIFTIPSLYVMVEKYFVRDKKLKTPAPDITTNDDNSEEKGGH
jgi:HAE1 family hydrophobic/amphiphilic exporter-1